MKLVDTMHKTALLIFLVTLVFTANCFATTVTFKNKATVTGSEVYLKDLVSFDRQDEFTRALGSQFIATPGAPGETIVLKSLDIINYLSNQLPLPPDLMWDGSENVSIYRDAIIIGPNKIEQIINEFLTDNTHRLPDAKISFIPKSYPMPFSLPQGKISYDITPSNPNILGSAGLTIILRVDGKVQKNLMIRGQLKALAEVAVSLLPLRRGTMIKSEHVAFKVQDVANAQAPVFNMDDLIGKRMRTNLKTNSIIELTDVENPPLIQKGEFVKIIVRSGGLHLTATGIAKSDGKLNEIIRVRNSSSNKLVHCRVSAPGLVEVNI